MCNGICAIALQRGDNKLLFKSGINSHDKIRDAFGIGDYRAMEQVNLEALPTGDFITDPWRCRVDHDMQKLPTWFVADRAKIESNFMDFVNSEILDIKKTSIYNGRIDLSGCTGLTSIPALTAKDWIDLSGCTGLTSIPALTADRIYLSGCTGIKRTSIHKSMIDRCIF